MKFATVNAQGAVTAFYDDEINAVPAGAIQIDDVDWQDVLQNPGMRVVKAGKSAPLDAAALLAIEKRQKNSELLSAYQSAIQQPIAYMSTTFQADEASQQTLTRCLVAGSVPSGFYWLDANNVKVTMTFAQLQGLAGAMLAQGQAAFDRLQTHKVSVNAATDVATVQAIVW